MFCLVPDPCLPQPCHINASCTREGPLSEGFICTCDTEFTGDGYNCTEIKGVVAQHKQLYTLYCDKSIQKNSYKHVP